MTNNINDLTNTLRPPLHEVVTIHDFFFIRIHDTLYKQIKYFVRGNIDALEL